MREEKYERKFKCEKTIRETKEKKNKSLSMKYLEKWNREVWRNGRGDKRKNEEVWNILN